MYVNYTNDWNRNQNIKVTNVLVSLEGKLEKTKKKTNLDQSW